MLHYVHQLVPNVLCLPFGAGQVMHTVFFFSFFLKQLPAEPENNADETGERNA